MKYILGSGPSALIAAFHFKDYTMLGPGFETPLFLGGPVILWDTPASRRFMKKLGCIESEEYAMPTREFKIAYYFGGKIHSERTPDMDKIYSRKLGVTEGAQVMSGGNKSIIGWDAKKTNFMRVLIKAVQDRRINCMVDEIQPANNQLRIKRAGVHEFLDYEPPLISTIPLPMLMKILPRGKLLLPGIQKFFFKPLFFYQVEKIPPVFEGDYDYLYILDFDVPIHRLTKGQTGYCLESIYPEVMLDPQMYGTNIAVYQVPFGRVLNSLGVDKVDDIINLGRYSQWDHHIRMSDVIKRCQELKEGL